MNDQAIARRREVDDLLTGTFNSILRVEERALENRLTQGLTITEIHTIEAVGYCDQNPMNVVAARLDVTLATLTTAVNRLVEKGFVVRTRDEADRRRVLVSLTKRGRQVYRAHHLFHKHLIEEALEDLSEEEEAVLCDALRKVKGFFDRQAHAG
ncbi:MULTISPECIES: MarR family winged helix-turn-helix transcriptional regulator [unclassified Adlercreutzia]|uniref:MarR family winged helix-turn-helix transcriptional regulator n=1 Tax=unclassified Adlercreutzia TaxID=2636013 RepID=UPI0013EBAE62|nr:MULTISPECIES: MarR family transcriptional regulator [unclassified Adlercreutzia]